MRHLLIPMILFTFLISCEDGETKVKDDNRFQNEFLFFLLKYREEGNCRKIITNNSSSKTTTCNRKPRGYCNISQSLITQGEVSYLFSEAKKVRDRNSDCETSFLQSGILLTSATTASDEAKIRIDHDYATITTCEDDGFTLAGSTKLATFDELKFLDSARGKIGKTAKALSVNLFASASIREKANLCLDKEFTESERNFLGELLSGKIISEISK